MWQGRSVLVACRMLDNYAAIESMVTYTSDTTTSTVAALPRENIYCMSMNVLGTQQPGPK
jgi:hypothetical protein